jgi:hypothetical protein
MDWTDAEDALIRAHYCEGWKACGALLPNRTRVAIKSRAVRIGAQGQSNAQESATPIPTHEYTDADQAMRGWRNPAERAPFVPALGLRA